MSVISSGPFSLTRLQSSTAPKSDRHVVRRVDRLIFQRVAILGRLEG
ncbi:hypothetical protein AB0894_06475 [Streptomyces sp. NPDC047916]